MTAQTDRLTAALADRYRLERELGQGGMATVYLAEDVKHRRKVALKVLRPELSAVIGAERFLKEIETTANLQHPHILPLHDSGAVDGTAFYVMPFVEGETLRDRLEREKQLPIDDAVRLTREIASALDYAHRKGVIHRDIKPENILLHEGQALVADFGIALAAATTSGSRMTETGMSLGTPHYMSPEQAMGERTVDARTDVYALGCVLYEMLVGEPPFTGPTAQAIVARVLTGAVEAPSVRRSTVPANVNAAVLTALQKLPADRFATAAAMSEALQDRAYGAAATPAAHNSRTAGRWNRTTMAATAVATLAVIAATWVVTTRSAVTEQPVMRTVMALPDSLEVNGFDLSPDGSRFVLRGRRERGAGAPSGDPQLWLRPADQLHATPIAATERALFPKFSPDGRQIGFVDGTTGAIKIVDLDGGSARTVADTGVTRSASAIAFAPDGSIIARGRTGLLRFPADGSPRAAISVVNRTAGEDGHEVADVLPNGRGVLFTLVRTPNSNVNGYDIAVLDLTSGQHQVVANGVAARYFAGYLLVVHANGVLSAAPFDQDKQRVTGPEFQVATDVRVRQFGGVDLAISNNGSVAYEAGVSATSDASLIWVSRDGAVTPVDTQWRANFDALSISPDGRQLAVSIGDGTSESVWIKQLDGGKTKLTLDGVRQYRPRWLPDNKTVSFLSEESNPFSFVTKRADGIGATSVLARLDRSLAEAFVSADGQWVIMRTSASTAAGRGDILARRLADSVVTPLVATKDVEERHIALSPDGKWLAYRSNESGRGEVYMRPFPNVNDGKWLVSLDGGGDPVWSHSGRELFYRSAANELWSASVATLPTFSVRERKKLFVFPADVRESACCARFDVAPGDQRFLMIQGAGTTAGSGGTKIVLVTNLLAELRRKGGAPK